MLVKESILGYVLTQKQEGSLPHASRGRRYSPFGTDTVLPLRVPIPACVFFRKFKSGVNFNHSLGDFERQSIPMSLRRKVPLPNSRCKVHINLLQWKISVVCLSESSNLLLNCEYTASAEISSSNFIVSTLSPGVEPCPETRCRPVARFLMTYTPGESDIVILRKIERLRVR